MSASNDIFSSIVLGRTETYDATTDNIIVFKNTNDIVNGILCNFSNMAGGFSFKFRNHIWQSSEIMYLCGEFSNDSERDLMIQEDIRSATSGYAAKRFKKAKYRKEVRDDFADFRLQWMLFVVWQKCIGNDNFRKKLLEVPEATIFVENTTTDTWESANIWGCGNKPLMVARKALAKEFTNNYAHLGVKALKQLINVETNKLQFGTWTGQNNIGKILKMCQLAIIHGVTPPIDYELLNRSNIYIMGELIHFS